MNDSVRNSRPRKTRMGRKPRPSSITAFMASLPEIVISILRPRTATLLPRSPCRDSVYLDAKARDATFTLVNKCPLVSAHEPQTARY